MATMVSTPGAATTSGSTSLNQRGAALAHRLEQGAESLASFAGTLTDAQWQTRMPGDGRQIGVIVHHVASVYPIEIQLAQTIAAGHPITGVTGDAINDMNAQHAAVNSGATRTETLALLRQNSQAAAEAIRSLSDEELDRATSVSLYGGAPLTCQFLLEDHAVRHSYHHLARIRTALTGQ